MNKHIISLAIMLLCSAFSFAQERITIRFADGSVVSKYYWEIESVEFEKDTIVLNPVVPEKAVDLGLSVKWAPFNIGAADSTEIGYKMGWGDPTGKIVSQNVKYFPSAIPPASIVNTNYDVAKALWGGEWRMPTAEEFEELLSLEKRFEMNGVWFFSENRTDSIFMQTYNLPVIDDAEPVAQSEDNIDYGVFLGYWTGMLSSDSDSALAVFLHDDTIAPMARYMPLAVRPVFGLTKPKLAVSLDNPKNVETKSCTLVMKFEGDVQRIAEAGIYYSTEPMSEPDTTATCKKLAVNFSLQTESLTVNERISGFASGTTYYVFCYAVIDGIYFFSEVQSFRTQAQVNYPAVDLGLPSGTKWADRNVGATEITQNGKFYSWGELEPHQNGYSRPDYSYYIKDTKNQFVNIGFDIAGTEYDVATAEWGEAWCMPTRAQIEELIKYCTFKIKYSKGASGFEVTGRNGNTIYIPAAGYKYDSEWYGPYDDVAVFWSSSLYTNVVGSHPVDRDWAWTFSIDSDCSPSTIANYRYFGMPVRAVRK